MPGIAGCCRFCYVWSCGPHPLNGLPHVICLCPCLLAHRIRVAAVGVDCIRVLGAMRLSILQAESMRMLSLSCQALPMLMRHGVFVPAFVSAHTAWATHGPASTHLPLLMFLNPLRPCPWKCLRLFVHIHTLAHARAATPHRSAMCLATLALGCSSQLVQLLLLLLLILMRSVAPWLLSLSLPFFCLFQCYNEGLRCYWFWLRRRRCWWWWC